MKKIVYNLVLCLCMLAFKETFTGPRPEKKCPVPSIQRRPTPPQLKCPPKTLRPIDRAFEAAITAKDYDRARELIWQGALMRDSSIIASLHCGAACDDITKELFRRGINGERIYFTDLHYWTPGQDKVQKDFDAFNKRQEEHKRIYDQKVRQNKIHKIFEQWSVLGLGFE